MLRSSIVAAAVVGVPRRDHLVIAGRGAGGRAHRGERAVRVAPYCLAEAGPGAEAGARGTIARLLRLCESAAGLGARWEVAVALR